MPMLTAPVGLDPHACVSVVVYCPLFECALHQTRHWVSRTMCHHLSNMADHSRVHFLQLRLSKVLLHLFHDFFTLIWPFVSSQKSPYFSRFPSFTDILTICLYDFNVCECSLKVWLDPLHPGYSCREHRAYIPLSLARPQTYVAVIMWTEILLPSLFQRTDQKGVNVWVLSEEFRNLLD